MKKKSVKYFLSILISIFQLISFSCDNPAQIDNDNLSGTWIHDDMEYFIRDGSDSIHCISRQEYNFLHNNDLNIARKEIVKETNMLLGFRYMAEGYYYLSGNKLNMVVDRAAQINDSSEHYFNDRTLRQISPSYTTVTFLSSRDTLIFIYPPCGPAENCIAGSLVLYRTYY